MIALVYAVFADAAEAERVARAMVEQDLAGCANVLAPCRSTYRWQGAIEAADETPVLFKTRPSDASRLMDAIAAAHSYDAPAILNWTRGRPRPTGAGSSGNRIPHAETHRFA